MFMDHVLTVADVQGIVYIRSQTPEYLRLIERGALRSFLGETQYVSLAFGGTAAFAATGLVSSSVVIWRCGRSADTSRLSEHTN